MGTITLLDFITWLKDGGPYVVLLFVIYSIVKGYLVPGKYYTDATKDRDWWRDRALELLELSDRTVDVAERAIRPVRGGGLHGQHTRERGEDRR